MKVSNLTRIRVVQFLFGSEGEYRVRRPVFRKIYQTMVQCPARREWFRQGCSQEIKPLLLTWITYQKHRFTVSWNEGQWQLTLPAENLCPWSLEERATHLPHGG